MSKIPDAEMESTYENVIANCPHCGFRNTFNRRSDLQDTGQIASNYVVLCHKCRQEFNISGDLINPVFEMLVYDCDALKVEKKYMYCILNLAQAYEVFFGLHLRVEFVHRPYGRDSEKKLEELNSVESKLYEKVKKYAYKKLRNVFINTLLAPKKASSLSEASLLIDELHQMIGDPSDSQIEMLHDQKLSGLLKLLNHCDIHELRNKVVHKRAFRPSLEEVQIALDEAHKTILFPLARHLGPEYDDFYFCP